MPEGKMKQTRKKKSNAGGRVNRKKAGTKKDIAVKILFVLYFGLLLYFLFFSERYGRNIKSSEYRYNLKPFNEIKKYIRYRHKFKPELFWLNIAGNVLAFVPLGYFIPRLSSRLRSFFKVFFISAFISLTIESLQLLLRCGSYDVDDLMLNVFGSCIGYFVFCGLNGKKKKTAGKKGRTKRK